MPLYHLDSMGSVNQWTQPYRSLNWELQLRTNFQALSWGIASKTQYIGWVWHRWLFCRCYCDWTNNLVWGANKHKQQLWHYLIPVEYPREKKRSVWKHCTQTPAFGVRDWLEDTWKTYLNRHSKPCWESRHALWFLALLFSSHGL